MSKTNKEIVEEFFDLVINQKQFDLYETYVSQDFLGHAPPYVGVGIRSDPDSQTGKIIIKKVFPGGPAEGVLQIGDEILRLSDDYTTLNTSEEIKNSIFGPGVIGTEINILVRREGQEHSFQLKRGVIPGSERHWEKKDMENFFKEYCPDLCFETQIAIEEGDLVAYYGINTGTTKEYGNSVMFAECGMFRLKDGKITESWAVSDDSAQLMQDGYRILPPEKKPEP